MEILAPPPPCSKPSKAPHSREKPRIFLTTIKVKRDLPPPRPPDLFVLDSTSRPAPILPIYLNRPGQPLSHSLAVPSALSGDTHKALSLAAFPSLLVSPSQGGSFLHPVSDGSPRPPLSGPPLLLRFLCALSPSHTPRMYLELLIVCLPLRKLHRGSTFCLLSVSILSPVPGT